MSVALVCRSADPAVRWLLPRVNSMQISPFLIAHSLHDFRSAVHSDFAQARP